MSTQTFPVTNEVITEILTDLQDEARQLLRSLEIEDPEESLRCTVQMAGHLDSLTAGVVGQARHRRLTWAQIGKILRISEDTARHRYTSDHIRRRLQPLTRAKRKTLANFYATSCPPKEPEPEEEPPPPVPRTPPSPAYNRLAPVMSMLARASQASLQSLAHRCGCSPSYMSRILNGERLPSWPIAERFATACGADTSVLREVWESEQLRDKLPRGHHPPPPNPLPVPTEEAIEQARPRLLTALRTLHVRAGQPSSTIIAGATQWQLTPGTVTGMLAGDQLTDWKELKRLLDALGGLPQYFKPLWAATMHATDHATAEADAGNGP